MEALLISFGLVVAVILLVRTGRTPHRPPSRAQGLPESRRRAIDVTAGRPSKTAPKPARPTVQPRAGRDCTPTPAGARAEMSPRAQRAARLAEEARLHGRKQIAGKAWVIDGDTIVIDGVHIRIAGIDAPELDQPFGQTSKWAMVRLCRGRRVTAMIRPDLSYDRVVAECRLEDGTDLAETLVREGLALDWPQFSNGAYAEFEPHGVRRRLWKTAMRQRS